jgi:hypothetical protein
VALVRLSIYDDLGGVPLGVMLQDRADAQGEALNDLVHRRTAAAC